MDNCGHAWKVEEMARSRRTDHPLGVADANKSCTPRWFNISMQRSAGKMMSARSRAATGLCAVATALFLASCSGIDDNTTTVSTPPAIQQTSGPERVAEHNAEDIAFAQNMIALQKQTLQLAALAPEHSTNPALLRLAASATGQSPEITGMKALLLQWSIDPNQLPYSSTPSPYLINEATMAKLTSLNGSEFDALWQLTMISHDQAAIEMAKAEIANGRSTDMITVANSVVATRQAAINQTKQIPAG